MTEEIGQAEKVSKPPQGIIFLFNEVSGYAGGELANLIISRLYDSRTCLGLAKLVMLPAKDAPT